jgi:hypothetical protein
MHFSRGRGSSGSFGVSRSLRGLSPLPAGPPRVSRLDHRPQPKPRADGPPDLLLSYRALGRGPESPLGDASSPGIRSKPVCPSTDVPPVRPLPGAEAPFGPTVPPVDRVPPSWFRTTMTACSARKLRVCCTPQPVQGSSRFPLPSASPTRESSWAPMAFPATRFTPFEDFPRQQPCRITAVVAFLPLSRAARRPPAEADRARSASGRSQARATVFAQRKRGTSLGR